MRDFAERGCLSRSTLKTYGSFTFCGLRHVGFVAPHKKLISGAAEAPARFEIS